MTTSSNGSSFRVTCPLCREFIGYRWIPLTKASDAELWYYLWSAPWINGWINNHEAGDLRRYRAHYDVIVMLNNLTFRELPFHNYLLRRYQSIWNFQRLYNRNVCYGCTLLREIWFLRDSDGYLALQQRRYCFKSQHNSSIRASLRIV